MAKEMMTLSVYADHAWSASAGMRGECVARGTWSTDGFGIRVAFDYEKHEETIGPITKAVKLLLGAMGFT